jgi:uncharacterized membrane protein HdeD (DUF308 family)
MALFPSIPVAFGGEAPQRSWWLYTLLGAVLLIAGAFVLGDVVFASAISAIFIAWAIVIAGIFEIVHAFNARGWKGFVFNLLLGVLYIAGGAILLANPVAASIKLTLALGIIWIVSGLFRIDLAAFSGKSGAGCSCCQDLSVFWLGSSSLPIGLLRGFGSWASVLASTLSSMEARG